MAASLTRRDYFGNRFLRPASRARLFERTRLCVAASGVTVALAASVLVLSSPASAAEQRSSGAIGWTTAPARRIGVAADAPPSLTTFRIDDDQVDPGQRIEVTIIARDDNGVDWIEFEGTNTVDPVLETRRFDCDKQMDCAVIFDIRPSTPGEVTLVGRAGDSAGQRSEATIALRIGRSVAADQDRSSSVPPQGHPYCRPGEVPQFVLGFASLRSQLGPKMGDPVECEHPNSANGDTLQRTTTGLAFYRKATNTPTFTNGFEHWGLTPTGLLFWTGDSIDPPRTTVASSPPSAAPAPAPPPPAARQLQIDPAVMPAWRALTQPELRFPDGVPIGSFMLEIAERTAVRIVAGPADGWAVYRGRTNTITISQTALGEDSRALATVLGHEMMHADQVARGYGGPRDCVNMEADAYLVGAFIWSGFWSNPPRRTQLEIELTALLFIAQTQGQPGLITLIVNNPEYQRQCELWVP